MTKNRKNIQILKYLLCIILLGLMWNISYSQRYTEYEVKAAYIFNFAKFVEWPDSIFASKDSPLILGIYNGDPFGDIIEKTFTDNPIKDRKWSVKYFKDINEITYCHILFIPRIDKSELLKVLNLVRNKSILTVGDNINEFCQLGGIINFTSQESKFRFEINNYEAKKSKLEISSKLLILSKIIKTNEIKF